MMPQPPFRLAPSTVAVQSALIPVDTVRPFPDSQNADPGSGTPPAQQRLRLSELNSHLHCSVIGTCLSTAELRKVVACFTDVHGWSDLEVHHEAVLLAGRICPAAKALHKALDQRHDATLQRFSKARDARTLGAMWEEACRQGEIPAAYWSLLTHRAVTPELRQKAFGDVHMLSHLVGAANRADIRRLAALENENADLRERLNRHLERSQGALEERDQTIACLREELAKAQERSTLAQAATTTKPVAEDRREERVADATLVAVQTERRERAEQAAATALAEVAGLHGQLERLQRHTAVVERELVAAETQLRQTMEPGAAEASALATQLRGRRILYVGGRPSSTPAIRDLVHRHGGNFQRHDGGLEDRKGLLASSVSAADLVVFPVDCIDHDSAGNLKRLCSRQGIPFLALRSASVASFAAGVLNRCDDTDSRSDSAGPPRCLKHG